MLHSELPVRSPEILLGAEVLYFPGIAKMEELHDLCIEGTNVLLLEMPFTSWNDYAIHEVRDLASSGRFTVLLAHIERYYDRQPRRVWDDLLDYNVLMQSNADFFLSFFSRRKALRLMKEGYIHLLGTDAHDMSSRAPHMDQAVAVIRKHLGDEYLGYVTDLSHHLLREATS